MIYECVALDVGGTYVKYGLFSEAGCFETSGLFSINEAGTRNEIVSALVEFLLAHPAHGVVISIPGPMDYSTGSSKMTHKFAALYDFSLKTAFTQALPYTDVRFVHDGAAFLLGELEDGNARGLHNVAGVMLGTGLGFVRSNGGRVLLNVMKTPLGPLWNSPFGKGIAEDYVSGRGIRKRYLTQCGVMRDAYEIAELARKGDEISSRIFRETGAMLGQMLTEHLRHTPVELVVVGGQIAKSLDLMLQEMQSACPFPITQAMHLDDAAIRGAYAYYRHGEQLLKVCD